MDISAALAADLAILTQALDADIDLEVVVRAINSDIKHAVSSYLGMTMTIALDGRELSFTVHDDTGTRRVAGTSLLIPLGAVTSTGAAGRLLLYAGTPGAFVDLAADLSYALGIDHALLVLDGHLDPPTDSDGITGLDAHTAINQAIGVLIARGHTPTSARYELHRLALVDHESVRGTADFVIRSTGAPPPDST